MRSFEDSVMGEIPVAAASSYFLKLKYGSAGPHPSMQSVLHDFSNLPETLQSEILKEAGVSKNQGEAVKDMARQDADGRTAASSDADRNDLIGAKLASVKKAHTEKLLPGTERYFSDNMLSVLQGLPAKSYYATQEKTASAFKLALEQSGVQDYLANEQAAMAAQEENEAGFLRQKMMEQQQQLQAAQQGQQATAEQMQALEQQIAQSQSQIQTAQQSALQAQTVATQAQQGQMSATDEAMRNAQLAAQMRMSYQQLRSQMMDIASQDPAQGLADQLKGQMPGAQGLGPEAVSMGQPPTQGPPMPEQGPAGQAPGAQASPDAAPPEGETGANNANANGQEPMMQGATPTLQQGMKQANVLQDRAMGAIGGGIIGGVGTALEARGGSDKARQRVEKLESQQGGFIHALTLAQAKARLALSEVAENHPVGATLAGSLIGAGIGAGAAPELRNLASK